MKNLHSIVCDTRHADVGFFFIPCAILLFLSSISVTSAQERLYLQDSLEVSSISFKGNDYFSSGVLRTLISTKEAPGGIRIWIYKNLGENFPGASEPQYFDYDMFVEDTVTLKQFYNNNGYFHATASGTYTSDLKKRKVDIVFTLHEGLPSFIDSIHFKNLERLPDSVRKIIYSNSKLKKGNRFSEQDVQDERLRIFSVLENNGYPGTRSDSIVIERKYSTNNVTITMPFYFGRRLYFGDISVKEDTSESNRIVVAKKLIYDRLDFKKGEVFSSAKLEQGEANLNRLKIFSVVQLTARKPSGTDTLRTDVPILISFQPKKKYAVQLGPVVNSQESRLNIGAETGFTWYNIFGAAQIFNIRAAYMGNPVTKSDFFWVRYQSYQGNLAFKFDQPYLFNNQTSGFWSINYVFAQEKDKYKVDVIQNILGMKWILQPQLNLGTEWTLEQSEFSKLDPLISSALFYRFGSVAAINYRNSILTTTLDRDWTNDFFNPTTGNFQKFVIEEAGLVTSLLRQLKLSTSYRNTQYYKFEVTSKWFADLSNASTNIFALKMKIGSIFRYGASKRDDFPVPFNRTYYAGGSNSVRGWNSKQLAVDSSKYDIGSNALFESSVEFRWNLFHEKSFLGFDLDPLWFVSFIDAGNLWNELSLLRISEVALALGVGIRYITFFGPIRIDFGMKMYDPQARTNEWITQRNFYSGTFSKGVLHLGLGHAF